MGSSLALRPNKDLAVKSSYSYSFYKINEVVCVGISSSVLNIKPVNVSLIGAN